MKQPWLKVVFTSVCRENCGESGLRQSGFKARQREDSDVVVLAEGDGGFGGLFRIGPGREKGFKALEAVEFAALIAGFEHAVSIEGEPVAMAELKDGFFVSG